MAFEIVVKDKNLVTDSTPDKNNKLEQVTTNKPIVRSRGDHNISRRDIDPDALKVLYRLARNNFTAYLVGGGVRDLLLKRKPKDFDISTNAQPEQIKEMFRNCILIGRRFRLAHIKYADKIIETSTFRRCPDFVADPSDPEADLFQRNDNFFGTPAEDALRRDFTVNGLFYDIESFCVIDYVGGLEDLSLKQIRCIGDPNIRFREDPVRMIRAIRFASRLDFSIEPSTFSAITKYKDELLKASSARLLEEILRLFAFSSGEKAMHLLESTGLLSICFPEISPYIQNESSRFWSYLKYLDAGDTVLPNPTSALIFSVLIMGRLADNLEQMQRAGQQRYLDTVCSILNPMAERLCFPRRLTDRIKKIFTTVARLGNPKKRFTRHSIFSQDWFSEALALKEIELSVLNKPMEQLKYFRNILTESLDHHDEQHNKHHGAISSSTNGSSNTTKIIATPIKDKVKDKEEAKNVDNSIVESSQEVLAVADPATVASPTDIANNNQPSPGQGNSRSARRRRNRRLKQSGEKSVAPANKVDETTEKLNNSKDEEVKISNVNSNSKNNNKFSRKKIENTNNDVKNEQKLKNNNNIIQSNIAKPLIVEDFYQKANINNVEKIPIKQNKIGNIQKNMVNNQNKIDQNTHKNNNNLNSFQEDIDITPHWLDEI